MIFDEFGKGTGSTGISNVSELFVKLNLELKHRRWSRFVLRSDREFIEAWPRMP